MKGTDPVLNQYIRKSVEDYRKRKKYTIEEMSEELWEESRSYEEQKRGRMGFSVKTLIAHLIHLTDMEILKFAKGLRDLVAKREKGELEKDGKEAI